MSLSPMPFQMPAMPDAVPVTLTPSRTALLIFDVIEDILERQPHCRATMLPAVVDLLVRARDAGVTVVYGTRAANMATWLPELSPAPHEIKIENHAQDRFYKTELEQVLRTKGISEIILTGWKISGSITYTSVGATLRGFTVIVPLDATSDISDFEMAVGRHQILRQSDANPQNAPLKPRASTLTRTDLISFT